MQRIELSSVGSVLDFDHGEGWVTFSWVDTTGLDRKLKIDIDGHCSREMPIRSGSGFGIVDIHDDSIRLCFSPELASKLELEPEVEFTGQMPDDVASDLRRLAELY